MLFNCLTKNIKAIQAKKDEIHFCFDQYKSQDTLFKNFEEKKTRFKKKTPIDFLNGKNNNEVWSKQLGQFWDTIMDLRI